MGAAAFVAADAMFACLAAAGVLGCCRLWRQPEAHRERVLMISYLAMLASFYLLAGPAALGPHFERYGVCLIAPGVLLLALGWRAWLQPGQTGAANHPGGARASGVAGMGLFELRYFNSSNEPAASRIWRSGPPRSSRTTALE